MGYPTKIATCCYCGTRAALVLKRERHELSCASCGAPLHDMKRFPKPRKAEHQRDHAAESSAKTPASVARPKSGRRKGKSKRKTLLRYLIKEAIDVVEDIFD